MFNSYATHACDGYFFLVGGGVSKIMKRHHGTNK
uniref:Uncharacterized protein n=1 Tax=Arundo donax TaxID=35708 RepID=A0A0A9A2I2_ARUDO